MITDPKIIFLHTPILLPLRIFSFIKNECRRYLLRHSFSYSLIILPLVKGARGIKIDFSLFLERIHNPSRTAIFRKGTQLILTWLAFGFPIENTFATRFLAFLDDMGQLLVTFFQN